MNTPIDEIQNHFHFQLSLLKLMNSQIGSESISAVLPVEIAAQQHLQDELAKIVDAIH